MEIKIDKNVPVPIGSDRRSGSRKYPLSEMNVGDSFFLPMEEGDNIKRMGNRMSQARQTYQKSHEGVRFTQRIWQEDEVIGLRVWRVE
tara:strand:- start:102 stop:365 length:264 start_codon:yes stop_codon:yes gene_type:complete